MELTISKGTSMIWRSDAVVAGKLKVPTGLYSRTSKCPSAETERWSGKLQAYPSVKKLRGRKIKRVHSVSCDGTATEQSPKSSKLCEKPGRTCYISVHSAREPVSIAHRQSILVHDIFEPRNRCVAVALLVSRRIVHASDSDCTCLFTVNHSKVP